jgi:phosphate transport system substrate-binding protein
MKPATRALAVIAFTTLVSCSTAAPASPPTAATVTLKLYATTATAPLVADLTGHYSLFDPAFRFEILTGNYQIMLDRLTAGEMPYFISNHLPIESQTSLGLWAAPIGQDGIAIITHPDTPIAGLSLEQLRDIYQGRIGNWSNLTGADIDIIVISREEGSGTRAEFEQQVMGTRRTTQAARIAPSSETVITSVANLPGSIGYVSISYLDDSVKALAIDNITPTLEHIGDNTYPLRSTLFVVGLAEPEAHYRAFIGWIQSPAGQSVVAQHYAPNPK